MWKCHRGCIQMHFYRCIIMRVSASVGTRGNLSRVLRRPLKGRLNLLRGVAPSRVRRGHAASWGVVLSNGQWTGSCQRSLARGCATSDLIFGIFVGPQSRKKWTVCSRWTITTSSPCRIRPVMDWTCSEMATATWEGSIQPRVIDRGLRETRQTGADGHNIIILGHGSGWSVLCDEVWWRAVAVARL